ncbi:MAG: 3-phosphoshikimate 1-carboxyvinyltransferase [Bacteroidetes bacterium]|nr:3-phosphoshikimate 1-carboxyvinyltransferase [Bacteroidota bacterium]
MLTTIQPSRLVGTVEAPASKSSMQRACAAALVLKGKSIIKNPGHSNDDLAALDILKSLGCEWSMVNAELLVDSSNALLSSTNEPPSSNISVNCGESGLGIRMFAPILALSKTQININGEGSLLKRPMDFFDEVLPQLGVEIISNQGKLPLKIKGPLHPKNIVIDGSLSSQFLTGLLLAFAAADAKDISIQVTNLKSKPYIDLTLKVMEEFGLKLPENKNYESFYFSNQANNQSSKQLINYTVEGDWSGGAFLLVAGAIAGKITVNGLDTNSTQADKKILEALKDSGCNLFIQPNKIEISNPLVGLRGFYFDATDCPDLFPPLVALAVYCKGETIIKGADRLTHKESNRALTLQEEFAKMGVTIHLQGNEMLVKGGNKIVGTTVHSRHDHRIAMACAVAALRADGETIIEDAEAINKSYTDFYDHLKLLGASLSTNHTINQSNFTH